VYAARGAKASIRWPLRTSKGEVPKLDVCQFEQAVSSSLSENSNSSSLSFGTQRIVVRIFDAFGEDNRIYELEGRLASLDCAQVDFAVPQAVMDEAGVYRLEIAIMDGDRPVFIDKGLLSIEPSLFGNINVQGMLGPLTILEVRTKLRDTLAENTLWKEFEFSDADIVYAIMRPIREWNETPPPVAHATTRNFPFRYHWLNATAAELLFNVALWYERNRLPSSHGGISVDAKAKFNPYMQVAQQLRTEWREFIVRQKAVINAYALMQSIPSPY
jgi:hypothetical protein